MNLDRELVLSNCSDSRIAVAELSSKISPFITCKSSNREIQEIFTGVKRQERVPPIIGTAERERETFPEFFRAKV